MLVHVVVMKFADAADAAGAKARLEALIGVVPSIRSLRVHLDELRTEVSGDLVMVSEHDDADGLRAYQAHPAHLEVGAWLRTRLSARTAVDYTAAPATASMTE
ncbi:Dabb family protein [Hamadaea tsunoensis]|uniref:Dabb family protein n=1 Tax=Hamadaea tsunoensis TaxID=53368 RepID=UPI0004236D56|nr:Dabb family protein [Hamadaea tsunoensis]